MSRPEKHEDCKPRLLPGGRPCVHAQLKSGGTANSRSLSQLWPVLSAVLTIVLVASEIRPKGRIQNLDICDIVGLRGVDRNRGLIAKRSLSMLFMIPMARFALSRNGKSL